MPSLVTDNFRIRNARDFVDSVDNDNYYLYLGGYSEWADDNAPPTPSDDIQEVDYDEWDSMFGAKKVSSADVKFMIPRIDWTSGTVYDEYDPDQSELPRTNHYVLSNDNGTYKVYKCITNNGGANSTSQPTATSASIFTTADGYNWKYMYTITTADAVRFLTPQFMPVYETVGTGNVDNNGPGSSPYPIGGHGADNVKELGAYYVGINVQFIYGEDGKLSTENDFRKVGLLFNPYLEGTTTLATGAVYRQTTRYTLSGASGTFQNDEEIQGTTPSDTATVVEYDSANNYLYVKTSSGSISASNTITGQTSSATATVSAIDDIELEPNSGEILYIENRKPTSRATDQIETILSVLEF